MYMGLCMLKFVVNTKVHTNNRFKFIYFSFYNLWEGQNIKTMSIFYKSQHAAYGIELKW